MAIVLLGMLELLWAATRWSGKVEGPRGAVVVQEREMYSEYEWVTRHARRGDGFFGDPSFNFLFGLENPAPLSSVTANNYTRPEQVESTLARLRARPVRFVLWSDELENSRAADDNLQPLRLYLRQHYRLAMRFGDGVEFMERLPESMPEPASRF